MNNRTPAGTPGREALAGLILFIDVRRPNTAALNQGKTCICGVVDSLRRRHNHRLLALSSHSALPSDSACPRQSHGADLDQENATLWRLAFGEASAPWRPGDTRTFCVFCISFVDDTSSQFFEELDIEPLLPDLPLQHGVHQQLQPKTVDPRQLIAVPELDSRQSYYSSSSSPSSSSSSSSPAATRSPDATSTPALTPQSASDSRSPPNALESLPPPAGAQLQRHHATRLHQPALYGASSSPQASLQCSCGKANPRRDNYKRHVKKCRLPARQPFRCNRGHTETDKVAWLAHLDDPGCKPPRGPPRLDLNEDS
ncbi:hypothetical protein G7Z17_g87 [Cylindrodendrum hubeiense]|uniref:Uncharacterized protein n=1 Tax=Cylindrodendrum hubeiense TaxID=595255 RepID=A0A9P5LMM8_9HYPO|nr:hypothetical protein G7Z17_g87 [Cylindrodendrum hubeiense]